MLLRTAYAQGVSTTVTNPLSTITSLPQVFGMIINIVLGVAIALTVIFMILGGIQYITSKGDQKAATQARDWLTNAVIGFIVSIGALAIRAIVLNLITGSTTVTGVTNVSPL